MGIETVTNNFVSTTLDIGPGRQNRVQKKEALSALNTMIPNAHAGMMSNERKVIFNRERCHLLYNMIKEKKNRQEDTLDIVYKLVENAGYDFMLNEYLTIIKHKKDTDDVVGGSLLNEFMVQWDL